MTSIQISFPLPLALKVACWNVRTLLDKELSERSHRRTALLARELSLYDIDIAGLSETSLADVGQLTEIGFGYTFLWKGKPTGEAREHGVGFAIKSSLSKNLQELPFGTSERVISLRLPLRQKTFCHNRVSLCPNQWTSLKKTYSPFMMS